MFYLKEYGWNGKTSVKISGLSSFSWSSEELCVAKRGIEVGSVI